MQLRNREMWAAIAIAFVWLAVLFSAIFGTEFVSTSSGGSTTIPTAIFIALFAFLATRPIVKFGFGARDDKD